MRYVCSYEISTRTFNAFFAVEDSRAQSIKEALRNAPETVVNPHYISLILCEEIVDMRMREKLNSNRVCLTHGRNRVNDSLKRATVFVDEEYLIGLAGEMTRVEDAMSEICGILPRMDGTVSEIEKFDSHLRNSFEKHERAVHGTHNEFLQRVCLFRTRMKGTRTEANMVKERVETFARMVGSFYHKKMEVKLNQL